MLAVGRRRGFQTTVSPSVGALSAAGNFVTAVWEQEGGGANWQLPLANTLEAWPSITYEIAHPRPAAECEDWAISRNAHTGVEWTCPVYISGGRPPFHFRLVNGPPGMEFIAADWSQSTDSDTGMTIYRRVRKATGWLRWANPTSGDHSYTVEVEDQDFGRGGNPTSTLSVTSTLTVGTSRWVVIDPVNGNNSGAGTLGDPWLDMTPLVSGSTHAGKLVLIRGGAPCTFVGMAASNGNYASNGSQNPCVFVGYPGENAWIVQSTGWFRFTNGANDAMLKDLKISHSGAFGNDQKMVVFLDTIARHGCVGCTFDNFKVGTRGANNGSAAFFDHAGTATGTHAIYCDNLHTGTQGSAFHTYGLRNSVCEGNAWVGCTFNQFDNSGHSAIYLKDDPDGVSVRFNEAWDSNTWSQGSFIGWTGQNGGMKNSDISYNTVQSPLFSGREAAIREGVNDGFAVTNVRLGRNSIKRRSNLEIAGPITNYVRIQNGLDTGTFEIRAEITDVGNVDGVTLFDSNMKLTSANKAALLGTIGAELAA